MKEILLMMYLITSVTSITMLSSFSITFLTMKKCNEVVFQSMLSGTVHYKTVRSVACAIFISFHIVPSLQKIKKKIYVMKDILRNVHVKYGCVHSRT